MSNSIRTTKKVLLAIGVIVVYIAYSLILRGQHSSPVVAQASRTSSSGSSASNSSGSGMNNSMMTQYKDGTYTGSIVNAYYGNVQVQVTISAGKIATVQFLQFPSDNPNSQSINQQATPYLKQEAIKAQSANVDVVTGATLTSQAFMQSVASALSQAKA